MATTHPVTKKPFRKGMRDDVPASDHDRIAMLERRITNLALAISSPPNEPMTIVATTRADTPAPSPIISSKVDDCWNAVSDLSKLIAVLADRLNPVLLIDPPSASSDSAEPVPDLSPLGHQLNGIEKGVRGNISRLTALLSRLTL